MFRNTRLTLRLRQAPYTNTATKKTTTKARTKKPAAKPKPTQLAPPAYSDIYQARIATNDAAEFVRLRERNMVRASTYLGDLAERDRRVAEAQNNLDEAIVAHSQAMAHFDELRKRAS